jgi:hypothetical protein
MKYWTVVPQALCLVLFPLSFLVLSNSGLHPGFGGSAAEQIQALAEDAPRWRWVHLGMAGGSMLSIVVLLTLRSLMPRPHIVAQAAVVLGIGGAAVLTGIFALEATLIIRLAEACVASRAPCLAPANQPFLDQFADLALNRVPLLLQSGSALLAAFFALAVMGQTMKSLVLRESLAIMVGSVVVFLYGPSLHGAPLGVPFFGFLILLFGFGALAYRLVRTAL